MTWTTPWPGTSSTGFPVLGRSWPCSRTSSLTSVLGRGVHFGAGAIVSNFRADHGEVSVFWDGAQTRTGLAKLGVMAGDGTEVGAQAVLNPGTILGRNCRIYPLVSVRGTIPPGTIMKTSDPLAWVPLVSRITPENT